MTIRENIAEINPDACLFTGLDDAIVGLAVGAGNPGSVVYSMDKVIEILMEDMDEEDALEHFHYNIAGAYVGEYTPVFVSTIHTF